MFCDYPLAFVLSTRNSFVVCVECRSVRLFVHLFVGSFDNALIECEPVQTVMNLKQIKEESFQIRPYIAASIVWANNGATVSASGSKQCVTFTGELQTKRLD